MVQLKAAAVLPLLQASPRQGPFPGGGRQRLADFSPRRKDSSGASWQRSTLGFNVHSLVFQIPGLRRQRGAVSEGCLPLKERILSLVRD
jgi:hypothetical protein